MTQQKPRNASPNPNDQTTDQLGSAAAPSVRARPLERRLLSPLTVLLGTLAVVYVAEFSVMLFVFVPLASDESPLVGAVIDSSVMVSLSAPILWWFIARSHQATTAVTESEARYRSLTENTFDLILETGIDARFAYVSPSYRDVLGYAPEELLGTSIFEPMHADDLQGVMQEFARAMNSNTPGAATFRYRHKNGEWRWFEAIGKPFPTGQGESRTVIVSRDITERKKADDVLKARDEQTRLIVETAYDAFVAMDTDGLITAWNRQAEDTFGWTRQEAIGKSMELIIPERTRSAHGKGVRHYMATGEGPVLNKRIELVALHRDGHEFPVELAVWPVQSGGTRAFNAFVHDITQRKQDEEALRALNQQLEDDRRQIDEMNLSLEKRIHERTEDLETLNEELRERNRQLLDARSQAATDALTSVPNHRAFQERIRAEVKRAAESGSNIGLIMLDIDGFKRFNDSLGHVAGDGILRHCADVLVDTLGHDSVFRYGGDEFAVILIGADEASALETAEHLRRAIEARNEGESGVTISLGVAAIPEAATTAEDLIYKADAAMYQAKSAGKNRVAGSSSLAADKDAPRPRATQVAGRHR